MLQPARGVVKTFNDVYVMTSISQVASISTRAGAPRLAIIMTAQSNQLQIIDPLGGVLEKVITLPQNLIARGLAWDPKTRTLYVGATNGRIYGYHYDEANLVVLGQVAPKAASLYGLTIDSTGRLWGGSYPGGVVWNYTPTTKKFAQLPRIDANSDYVRSLAITADDTVYVGTGTTVPKVVCFPAESPGKRTTLKLPMLPPVGFVNQITVNGDRVLINADKVKTQLVWNHRTKKITTAALEMAQRQSAGSPGTQTSFWINNKVLYSTDATTGKDTPLGSLGVASPEHIWTGNDSVYILNRDGTEAVTHRFDLKTKKATIQSSTTLKGAGVAVHSLLAHTDGKLYVGGFQGQGIATLNPDNGAHWQSLDTVAPNQISGMVQWDAKKTFIGSYGSGDIISFATSRAAEGNSAFKLLERLRTKYGQSRPYGWARNKTHVFFGTVPEYGLSGGALGIIDPLTDTIEGVYNKLIPNHSIIGLVADEKYVYGTTSTRNGYGLPDTKGNAKVFAFDLATKKLAWTRHIPGHKAAMKPILVADRIVAATLEGLVILKASNGTLVQSHAFTGLLDKNFRPGWSYASVEQLGDSHRFVHAVEGAMHVVDLQNGTLRKVHGTSATGTVMTATHDGRVFVNQNDIGVAEVATEPRKRS
ncbi:hypothetical protein Q2T94_17015 [Paeniglutamicibacter sulfureus]|uniref:hypothetical protein n=1 Tax=Paeniglutamicibacter sulfureus TaxID=43666 RepID=UPI0026657B1D|nr:hypothetical protein [Paeniglutamicibacter sulfureus]MDO2936003.1 hypothetical protein [Paeniglutamicibacter sulfureus]